MAGVAVRILLQIILMLRFRLPKIAGRRDLGHDLARPQARGIDIGNGVFGDPSLLVTGVEDRRAIAQTDVVALAVPA